MAPVTFNNRNLLLGLLLLITIIAAVWPEPKHEPSAQKSATGTPFHPPKAQAAVVSVAFAPLVKTPVPHKQAPIGNLFSQQTWTPAPVASTLVHTVPVAPPLPFTFAGRYTEGSKITVYLMDGTKMLRVQQGETINEKYRIDKIEQASLSITYLPLGTTQILPTGVLLP